jgi:hypothetical protein
MTGDNFFFFLYRENIVMADDTDKQGPRQDNVHFSLLFRFMIRNDEASR